jgi:hypothetical protein
LLDAKDVAVLIDVSGTMANYGPWQEDVRRLVTRILWGGALDGDWRQDGSTSAAAEFRLDSGDHVRLLQFGSVQTPAFPFFAPASTVAMPAEFESNFPIDPSRYREARTNKPLAIAVGAHLVSGAEGLSRLIVISDFLVDSDATVQQQEHINQFESKAKVESPLIYSWNRNPHIQIKLLRISGVVSTGSVPIGSPPASDARLQITGAKLLDSPRRLLLSWNLVGTEEEATYSVTIRDPKSGKTILSRTVLSSSLLVPNPPSGKFVWQIVAKLRRDVMVSSPLTQLDIPGETPFGVIALLVLAAAGGFGLWHYSKRRKPAAEQEGKEKSAWKA